MKLKQKSNKKLKKDNKYILKQNMITIHKPYQKN
jgi:hypothetical protein